MRKRFLTCLLPAVAVGLLRAQADEHSLEEKIQAELTAHTEPAEGKDDGAVSKGEFLQGDFSGSKIYPGTVSHFEVYVPAGYRPEKPACLFLELDGLRDFQTRVLDHLIAEGAIPMMIGVGIASGTVSTEANGNKTVVRYDRSYEFDSVNGNFSEFVLKELLPHIETLRTSDGRMVRFSKSGSDHMALGASTGGIGSFTLAWERPDQFTRVYSSIGTFVSMRGGNEYPALIRKTEPKPIRIFLEDGSTDAWNALFGSWFEANTMMVSALRFAGYDVGHAWGLHGHDGRPGELILPDVMRWLWRDYPQPIGRGWSENSTLRELLTPAAQWQKIAQILSGARGLAADQQGSIYVRADNGLYRIAGDKVDLQLKGSSNVAGQAFDSEGTLYTANPDTKTIRAMNANGKTVVVADEVAAQSVLVTHNGTVYASELYASEPGAHEAERSRIWMIRKGGEKKLVDEGLQPASGVAISPDGTLFYAAEKTTQWVYSYVVNGDGTLRDKQRFFRLHTTDIPDNSGAEDMAVDTHGNLFVATRMGIQICDQNGRVRAILMLPGAMRAVTSLCFGGVNNDLLFASDGSHIYWRKLNVKGYSAWSPAITVNNSGAG